MPFSPEEIASKHFVVTLRGYDRAEVDAYLRALASDQARLLRRISELEPSSGQTGGPAVRNDGDAARLLDDALRAMTELRRHLPAAAVNPTQAGPESAAPKAPPTARTKPSSTAGPPKAAKAAKPSSTDGAPKATTNAAKPSSTAGPPKATTKAAKPSSTDGAPKATTKAARPSSTAGAPNASEAAKANPTVEASEAAGGTRSGEGSNPGVDAFHASTDSSSDS